MLRRPIPWLVRTAPVVDRRARRFRARALSALARSQLGGELVAPAVELAGLLAQAAPRRLLPGAALTEIARVNLAAHGAERLAAAARAASALVDRPGDRARLARAAARALEEVGNIRLPLALLAGAGLPRARLELHARLLDQGVTPAAPVARTWTPAARRILYHAAQSLPHLSSGYAIRTHWLARSLRESGWDLTVVNRLGYPNDRLDHIGVS